MIRSSDPGHCMNLLDSKFDQLSPSLSLSLSETPVGLHTQLNSLHIPACTYQLTVHMKKTNIVVFRKGGYWQQETGFFDGEIMPVVNSYKYLGILYFSTRHCFGAACQHLASRSKKCAVVCLHAEQQFLGSILETC